MESSGRSHCLRPRRATAGNMTAYFRSLAGRFFHRSQTENDLEEELRSHIQLRAEAVERSGLARPEAERRARLEFGSPERLKGKCRARIAGTCIDCLLQHFSITSQ